MRRHEKYIQDRIAADNLAFMCSNWSNLSEALLRERAVWASKVSVKVGNWRMDFTEGRNRMRKKLHREREHLAPGITEEGNVNLKGDSEQIKVQTHFLLSTMSIGAVALLSHLEKA